MYERLATLGQTDRIIFIAHGFLNTGSAPWIEDMKNAILRVENATVIVVDWGRGANMSPLEYPQAASNTQTVGEWVGTFANTIRQKRGRSVKIWGIGHGIGAHLMARAGRECRSFDRVTGLDPAGPMFEQCNENLRLSKDVPNIVDVIHTDGLNSSPWIGSLNHYGTLIPLGTTDFYPNWCMEQPGTCNDSKSHVRAVELFVWSISNKGTFETSQIVLKTPSFQSISHESIVCDEAAEMGFYFAQRVLPPSGRCYHIETGDKEPWNEHSEHDEL